MQDEENQDKKSNAPVHKVRLGAVTASVWEKVISINGKSITVNNVTFQKSFRDKAGNWKNTPSFHLEDLLSMQVVLRHTIDHLIEKNKE